MKEEVEEQNGNNGLLVDDDLMDEAAPLSIDETEDSSSSSVVGTAANAGIIRINKGIQNQASNSLKRKAESNGLGPIMRKARPSNAENESDISTLEKEIRALHWLARRKEQEWDQVIRLLKQKEERLMQAQRTRTLIRTDTEHVLSRSLVLPKRHTILINNPTKPVSRPVTTATTTVITPANTSTNNISSSPVTNHNNVTASVSIQALEITEDKITNAIQKATENLGKEAVKEKTKTPICQGCKKRKSEFVCAGCSNRWYCSRECQVEDWDDHADECSG